MRDTVWMIMQKAFSFYEVHSTSLRMNFRHCGMKISNICECRLDSVLYDIFLLF